VFCDIRGPINQPVSGSVSQSINRPTIQWVSQSIN